NHPELFEMLSSLGRELFFPKGILSQSAEAKEKAYRFNATIGIALEKGEAMHLGCVYDWLKGLSPNEVFPYAPAAGLPALRSRWMEKQLAENPAMRGKRFGKPIVTSALTHGLSIVGDLFVDPGDPILLPDKFWGNYRLLFEIRKGARIVTYPLFDRAGRVHVEALGRALEREAERSRKALVILNFPNNPCGYSVDADEAEATTRVLVEAARKGLRLVTVLDDAYFGLTYTDEVLKESLFGFLANRHERLLAVKLDGATKEQFVWGFRVGFITYGAGLAGDLDVVYGALEKKTMGAIRGNLSNGPHLSQTLVLKALESPAFAEQKRQKFELLRARARKVMQVLGNPAFDAVWTPYPFNSGYFMCLELKRLEAEKLRTHLLQAYGVGVIASGERDIRIAFSCIEESDIPELFDLIYRAITELQSRAA
ncbi:MAG: aminotransferase class I/II-fold pyridoxal phosphate-dependent enzyme, partial [bacterium]